MQSKNVIKFSLLALTGLWAQTEYAGEKLTVPTSVGVVTKELAISASGTITDLNIKMTTTHPSSIGMYYWSMNLTSPSGTTVQLFPKSSTIRGGLYKTMFDDEASNTFTENGTPYTGSFKPIGGSLSDLDGETITGTWTLSVYADNAEGGEVSEWSIFISTDNSTPKTPTNYGTEYAGEKLTVPTSVGVVTKELAISASGTITDLNIKMTTTHPSSIGMYYWSMNLTSPSGTTVQLFPKSSTIRGGLYKTMFDDEASNTFTENGTPYTGSFKPIGGSLSDLDGETITGTWTLSVYADNAEGGEVSEWSIFISTRPPVTIFSGTPTSGKVPLTVQFTDQSVGVDASVSRWK